MFQKNYTNLILILVLNYLSIHCLQANHLIGGTMSYKIIKKSAATMTLSCTMLVYRDCSINSQANSTPFDDVAIVGIWETDARGYEHYLDSTQVRLTEVRKFGECIGTNCIEEGEYKWEMELPNNYSNYTFIYQRCCRTSTISNILDSRAVGTSIVLVLTKEAQLLDVNSSPKLAKKLPLGICVGEPINLNLTSLDENGDSIAYVLKSPFQGASMSGPRPLVQIWPRDSVIFNGNYTSQKPFGDNVSFENGIFKGKPNVQGEFLFGIEISEFRNGVLLSKSFIDYTVDVFNCNNSTIDKICYSKPDIQGSIFYDFNNDNVRNSNEIGAKNIIVSINNNTQLSMTNDLGNYSVKVDTLQSYTFKPTNFNAEYFKIVPISRTVTTTNVTNQTYRQQDFALQALKPVNNLKTNIFAGDARPGFNSFTVLTFTNIGTSTLNGTLNITIAPNQSFIASDIPPTSQSFSSLSWAFSELKPFEQRKINVNLFTNINAVLNSKIVAKLEGNISAIDIDTSDNTSFSEVIVRGSYDPNEIIVNKTNVLTADKIVATPLEYTIKFQNTGNAMALNVVLIDTLNEKLNLNTIEMLGASHSYNIQIIDNFNKSENFTVLKWTFDNINLRDLTTQEELSHGFVRFRIKTDVTKMPSKVDSIFNKAAIYFDFNPPVITNRAKTLFSPPVATLELNELKISVFPNPTEGILNISTSNKNVKELEIEVINLNGQVLKREILRGVNPEMNIQELASGLYFLKIKTAEGIGVAKIFKQ
jgi:uncharacterized repeat protein (TIGR01451 family)